MEKIAPQLMRVTKKQNSTEQKNIMKKETNSSEKAREIRLRVEVKKGRSHKNSK